MYRLTINFDTFYYSSLFDRLSKDIEVGIFYDVSDIGEFEIMGVVGDVYQLVCSGENDELVAPLDLTLLDV